MSSGQQQVWSCIQSSKQSETTLWALGNICMYLHELNFMHLCCSWWISLTLCWLYSCFLFLSGSRGLSGRQGIANKCWQSMEGAMEKIDSSCMNCRGAKCHIIMMFFMLQLLCRMCNHFLWFAKTFLIVQCRISCLWIQASLTIHHDQMEPRRACLA